jgi:transcriptional regulator GlxA family with amidase domain
VDGKPVRTVSDLTVTPGHGPEVLAEADTVIIPGYAITQASAAATDSKALDALSSVRPGTRLVSICSGAFLLAGAGLLDGRRATTHWALSDHFRELFPGSSSTPAFFSSTRSPASASCRRTGTAGRHSTSSGHCRRRAQPAPG